MRGLFVLLQRWANQIWLFSTISILWWWSEILMGAYNNRQREWMNELQNYLFSISVFDSWNWLKLSNKSITNSYDLVHKIQKIWYKISFSFSSSQMSAFKRTPSRLRRSQWNPTNSFVCARKLAKITKWLSSIWTTQTTRSVDQSLPTRQSWIQPVKSSHWKVSFLFNP